MTAPAPAPQGAAILDSHSHAWRLWPYPPAVPDEDARGTVEQLLYEMDANGVAQALVVCAAIGANPDNTAYVAHARERHPGRFHLVGDLDCTWSSTYHQPGSADRLRELDDRYGLTGITHYLDKHNDGWLLSDQAEALFSAAAQRRLLVSLAAGPSWQADLRVLARRHPDVKASGFHYAAEAGWDYPWPDALEVLRRIFDAYGPARLCWGSDFPASKRFCTFRQSLEAVRTRCSFLTEDDLRLVMGGTLGDILAGLGVG